MGDEDFQALKDDIEVNGQREPVWILDEMVLDGWHRYRACIELGIKPTQFNFQSDDDPSAFVISHNLHRRHLTASQRAAAVIACSAWRPAHREKKSAILPTSKTHAQMAKEAGVAVRTISDAKAAKNAGLIDPVIAGAISANEAAKIARGTSSKPEVVAPPMPDDGAPDDAELEASRAQVEAESKTMELLLSSDEPLAAVAAKNTQLEAQIKLLNLRIAGLQNSNTEYIRTIKSLQAKIKKLESAK